MTTTSSSGSRIVSISSILTLVLFLIFALKSFVFREYPDFYTAEDKWKEASTLFSHLGFLLPAIIGLIAMSRGIHRPWMNIVYGIYGLMALYFYTSPFWSDDPLAAGIPFVTLGLPFGIVVGLIMLFNLFRKK